MTRKTGHGQYLGPPQYFAQYFLHLQKAERKSKNPLSLAGQRVQVELLTRFELVTSSLPTD